MTYGRLPCAASLLRQGRGEGVEGDDAVGKPPRNAQDSARESRWATGSRWRLLARPRARAPARAPAHAPDLEARLARQQVGHLLQVHLQVRHEHQHRLAAAATGGRRRRGGGGGGGQRLKQRRERARQNARVLAATALAADGVRLAGVGHAVREQQAVAARAAHGALHERPADGIKHGRLARGGAKHAREVELAALALGLPLALGLIGVLRAARGGSRRRRAG